MASVSPTLLAFTTAALALPGVSHAKSQPTGIQVDVQASGYREKELSASDVAVGDTLRYEIDVYQFSLSAPVLDGWSASLNAAKEMMSGASPWGVAKDVNGDPILIMSGATIEEERTEVGFSMSNYVDDRTFGMLIESSRENDYQSLGIGFSVEQEHSNKLDSIGFGFSYSNDTIKPTDALLFGRVVEEKKYSLTIFASINKVIDATSQIQLGLGYANYRGFLSDPYKLRDVRPDDRNETTISARYRKYIARANAALHVDYRYYLDDYDIHAHTLELAWYQSVGDHLKIAPSIRYYSQNEADFYLTSDDFLLPEELHQSSDYRLSAYGAFSFGFNMSVEGYAKSGHQWRISLDYEHYMSDGSYSLASPDVAHPGLMDFDILSLGFSRQF